jgi:hypothetical protein
MFSPLTRTFVARGAKTNYPRASNLEIPMRATVLIGVALSLGFAAVCAVAQSAPPGIIRGAIVGVDGANLSVRTKAGETIALHLKDGQNITAVIPAQLSDIKPGVFVGAAAVPGKDGALMALEVHIFPEAQRGSGEGFRPFDLAPGSSMTNANISSAVDTVNGQKLTLTYKGGEQTVIVDKATPIVTFAAGEAGDLKAGASIDIFRPTKTADGAYESARIVVGRNGTKVPM